MGRYGQYEIRGTLGQGGMGVVCEVWHPVLRRRACVKELLPEFTTNADIVRRFLQEATIAASLDHPNIVGVYDCSQTSDGTWYIVLEFLEGVSLKGWLRKGEGKHGVEPLRGGVSPRRPVDVRQMLRIMVPLASALDAAHGQGIVHRDVKPDNVYLVRRATIATGGLDNTLHPILLDFGISKAKAERLTRTGSLFGTVRYMAPEQINATKDVDRRADVYSLGVMLYEMATGGWHPWADPRNAVPAYTDVYLRQVSEPPPDPRVRNPGVSPELAEVIRRALAPDPRDRTPDARELALGLAETVRATGSEPSGLDLVRALAPGLCDPADTRLGRRIADPPPRATDDSLWRPPATAVAFQPVTSPLTATTDAPTRVYVPPPEDDDDDEPQSSAAPPAAIAVAVTTVPTAPGAPRALAGALAARPRTEIAPQADAPVAGPSATGSRPAEHRSRRWTAGAIIATVAAVLLTATVVVLVSGGSGAQGAAASSTGASAAPPALSGSADQATSPVAPARSESPPSSPDRPADSAASGPPADPPSVSGQPAATEPPAGDASVSRDKPTAQRPDPRAAKPGATKAPTTGTKPAVPRPASGVDDIARPTPPPTSPAAGQLAPDAVARPR